VDNRHRVVGQMLADGCLLSQAKAEFMMRRDREAGRRLQP